MGGGGREGGKGGAMQHLTQAVGHTEQCHATTPTGETISRFTAAALIRVILASSASYGCHASQQQLTCRLLVMYICLLVMCSCSKSNVTSALVAPDALQLAWDHLKR